MKTEKIKTRRSVQEIKSKTKQNEKKKQKQLLQYR